MLAKDIIFDWNNVDKTKSVFRKPIELCDETLRDGIQSPSVTDPNIETKLKLVKHMDRLGITIANIGLPGAGKRAANDVSAIATFVRDQHLNIKVNCAARTLVCDIEPIAAIQQKVGIPIAAYCFLGASPIRQYVEGWNLDKMLLTVESALNFAMKQNLEVAFVTEDTTRSKPDTLEVLFKHAISLGSRRLVLCDTVGHATPDGVKNLVNWTKKIISASGEDVSLDWHGHNDRGFAVVNAIFAAEYGCDRIHGTALGIGERVGNAAIDQLIVNFKLLGKYPHQVSNLVDYVGMVSDACGVDIPCNYPLCGEDAFRTATGVHAAAVIKAEKKGHSHLADIIYSGVPAGEFGKEQCIEIGPMSGLSNIKYWLEKRGVPPEENLVQAIFESAKASDKVLAEDEIWKLVT